MFKNLRHTFLLFTALCMMAACGDSQEPENQQAPCAMKFDVAGLTRATHTTSQNITASPFAVYGDMKFIENQSLNVILNGSEIFYDGSNWKYDDTQYWFPNHEHSFVALHPVDAPSISEIKYLNSQLQFTYTYPLDNYKKATDLLVSAHRRRYTDGTTDPVYFTFDHILSNINIQVTYTNPAVDPKPLIVNSITLKNIPAEATYDIAPATLNGLPMTNDYTNDPTSFEGWTITDRGDLKIEFPETGAEAKIIPPDKTPHKLFSSDDALLLLPNPDTTTEMVVSYTTFNGSESLVNTDTFTIPQSWRPGLNYTLSLTIINGKVLFSIQVAKWQYTDPINTTVPR